MRKCQSLEASRYFLVYSTSSDVSFFIIQVLCCLECTVLTLGNTIICSVRMCRNSKVSVELPLYSIFQKYVYCNICAMFYI